MDLSRSWRRRTEGKIFTGSSLSQLPWVLWGLDEPIINLHPTDTVCLFFLSNALNPVYVCVSL